MRDVRTVEETGSTNDDVARLLAAGAGEGLWLRAVRQTGGRGRQGRAWGSLPGNLHASTAVVVRPGDPPAATLALVAAVALHETLAAYGATRARIKWPNDLLIDKAKIAGILLERHGDGIVVGFGVNLAAHPEGIDQAAASMPSAGVAAPEPGTFLVDLAQAFARWLGRWRGEGLPPVLAAWQDRAHPPGTPLTARMADGGIIDGLFEMLGADGALRLRLADGTRHVMHAGDVFLL